MIFQMARLREQYKLQQQHLLKLLELLEIGNCVTVIEAECTRTESTIFDADIVFDLEAQPIHLHRENDLNLSFDETNEDLSPGSSSSSLNDDPISFFNIDDLSEAGLDIVLPFNEEELDKLSKKLAMEADRIISLPDDCFTEETSDDHLIGEASGGVPFSRLNAANRDDIEVFPDHSPRDDSRYLLAQGKESKVDAVMETVL